MDYTCLVFSEGRGTPFMDVFAAVDVDAAIDRCLQLMAERPQALKAELYAGERLYRTIELKPLDQPMLGAELT